MNKINILVGFQVPMEWQKLLRDNLPSNYNIYFCNDSLKTEEINCIILSPIAENVIKDFSKFRKLSMLHVWGVGTSHIPIEYLKKRKIKIYLLKDSHETYMAEYILANILIWEKRILFFNSYVHSGKWKREEIMKMIFMAPLNLISEKTLLIIGLGKTGTALAELAKRNNMKVVGIIKDKKNKYNQRYFDEVVCFKDKDSVLKKADYISLNVSLNQTTKGMINKEFLTKMKRDAVIINTSRGNVIVEDDLIKVLDEKVIKGASLDVFSEEPLPINHPFLKMKNVILTPHISGSSSVEKTIKNISYNIKNYFTRNQMKQSSHP